MHVTQAILSWTIALPMQAWGELPIDQSIPQQAEL